MILPIELRLPHTPQYQIMMMNVPDNGDDIFKAWPDFLDQLDSNPMQAKEKLAKNLYKYTKLILPAFLRGKPEEDIEDYVHDLFEFCCRNNFQVLRKYKNTGHQFAGWLCVVAYRFGLTRLRQRPEGSESSENYMVKSNLPDPFAKEIVRDCLKVISKIKRNCYLLLLGWAEGLKPRQLLILGGYPPGANKRVWDDLEQCKKAFLKCIRNKGLDRRDI